MANNTYNIKASDAGCGLIEGKQVTPYYEDAQEIILSGNLFDHHVRKNGEYFQNHFEKVTK